MATQVQNLQCTMLTNTAAYHFRGVTKMIRQTLMSINKQ